MKVRKHVSPDTPPATAALSDFLSGITFTDIPPDVVTHATKMITDTIGVSLGAVGSKPIEIARSIPDQTGASPPGKTATVLGYGDSLPVRQAAFLNGMLANALDFDDLHQRMGGHPSSPILPAVLALGESRGIAGEEFITAFVAGVEVEAVLGSVLNPGHYERGWHPTSVLGHMGATAAAGVLLGLDADGFQSAFGIATSTASGSKANLGSMTKPYHVGNAARSGIEAAQLGAASFTARKTILEDGFGGFCDLFKGDMGYEFDEHLNRLGDPWAILDPPVVFKRYPCCASAHAAIDCAIHLKDTHDIDPATIDAVTVTMHPRRLQHTDDPRPTTGLEGKISVQYLVARAFVRGDVWIDDFTETGFSPPSTEELIEKINVHRDPGMFKDDQWGAHVSVTTTQRADDHYVPGPDGSIPTQMTTSDLHDKYTRCASNVLSREAINQSLSVLTELPTIPDTTTVIEALTQSAYHS